MSIRCRTTQIAAGLALLWLSQLPTPLWSQTNTFPASGNVGIGTTSPLERLDIGGGALAFTASLNPTGDVGYPRIYYGNPGDGNSGLVVRAWKIAFQSGNYTDSTTKMFINSDGKVGIGTTAPQYNLSVNGIIQAKEILVNTGWSDYVFDAGYRLTPLQEVSAYVQTHHHLPGIPSAAEVAEKGIGLGEMQSKLLAKIEELTLHMIRAEEENRLLSERVALIESAKGGR